MMSFAGEIRVPLMGIGTIRGDGGWQSGRLAASG
jgi:hypothetical protein